MFTQPVGLKSNMGKMIVWLAVLCTVFKRFLQDTDSKGTIPSRLHRLSNASP